MKIPYFKAIDTDTGKEVRGFYFEYPETTYCFTEDYESIPIKVIPCIMTHSMTDWGLPNRPMICTTIDKSTLKQIGYIETENDFYKPGEWVKQE